MTLGAGDAVLCSGTLPTAISFRQRIAAAVAGGFSGISLWGRDYQVARDEGLRDRDIRLLLADHGLTVGELDPAWWWPPGADEIHIPPEHDQERIFRYTEPELFAVAEAVGARSLNAVDVFGGAWTLDEAAAAFAGLCDRAAEHGLLVHLEFLPWSRIPDLATAWQVVAAADRPNGGLMLDSWHYFRSTPDGELLRSIPGTSILGVQLSDAPATPEPEPLHATLHERLLPGEGELPLPSLLADLRATATEAPLGVEVFSDVLHGRDPVEVGRRAGTSLRALLGPEREIRPGRGGRD
ncbi:MAG TPA: sugar phosphate isomerase/epimerase [Acidimicrobiales bacterium]|jgi:sugar phosphate isomerase/epimerase|nr:sugar phosphate isomerase/epimerase [Acidimicrobiales bacterium]